MDEPIAIYLDETYRLIEDKELYATDDEYMKAGLVFGTKEWDIINECDNHRVIDDLANVVSSVTHLTTSEVREHILTAIRKVAMLELGDTGEANAFIMESE